MYYHRSKYTHIHIYTRTHIRTYTHMHIHNYAQLYRNKLVTDNPKPLTAPNLSGVTELLMKSAWHTKQLAIATLMMSNSIIKKVHKTAGLEEYIYNT